MEGKTGFSVEMTSEADFVCLPIYSTPKDFVNSQAPGDADDGFNIISKADDGKSCKADFNESRPKDRQKQILEDQAFLRGMFHPGYHLFTLLSISVYSSFFQLVLLAGVLPQLACLEKVSSEPLPGQNIFMSVLREAIRTKTISLFTVLSTRIFVDIAVSTRIYCGRAFKELKTHATHIKRELSRLNEFPEENARLQVNKSIIDSTLKHLEIFVEKDYFKDEILSHF